MSKYESCFVPLGWDLMFKSWNIHVYIAAHSLQIYTCVCTYMFQKLVVHSLNWKTLYNSNSISHIKIYTSFYWRIGKIIKKGVTLFKKIIAHVKVNKNKN